MVEDRISHYRVLEQVGRGGMGLVYRAQDTLLERTVALKFLPRSLTRDPLAQARLLREARAASALDHPNICTVFEIAEGEDGRPFIAMAFCDGEDVQAKIDRGPLPMETALEIAIQVAQGLEAAHQAGVVHRDVKPGNILVSERGVVKLVDFGTAKVLRAGEASTGEGLSGTPAYMAPEQLEGGKVDARTDVWALGVVLFEMLTGSRPFGGKGLTALLQAVVQGQPMSITELRPETPSMVAAIIERTLRKTPADRYPSMGALLDDLRTARRLLEEPTLPYPAGVVPRRPPPRASRLPWILTSLLVLLLLGLGWFVRDPARSARPLAVSTERYLPVVAVLPLANLSGQSDEDFFADGLTEALITELAKIGGLRVIARSSATRYRDSPLPPAEVAKSLGADFLIEGSVLSVSERVHVTMQLIDPAGGTSLWAERYDERLRDVMAVESAAALAIARAVEVELSPQETVRFEGRREVDPEAYRLYLRGRYWWNQRTPESLLRSVELFEHALERDPESALAYTGLADAYNLLGGYGYGVLTPHQSAPRAKAAALRALELDSQLAEAHSALAQALMTFDWDWSAAEQNFRTAIELNPSYATAHQWYSELLSARGRHEEAADEIALAHRLDPLSLIINNGVALQRFLAGDYEQAAELLRANLEVAPEFWVSYVFLSFTHAALGRSAEALAPAERAVELSGGAMPAVIARAYALALTGEGEQAEAMLAQLAARGELQYVSPSMSAYVDVALGERERALEKLERAVLERDAFVIFINVMAPFEPLRGDPRFERVLAAVGLRPRASE